MAETKQPPIHVITPDLMCVLGREMRTIFEKFESQFEILPTGGCFELIDQSETSEVPQASAREIASRALRCQLSIEDCAQDTIPAEQASQPQKKCFADDNEQIITVPEVHSADARVSIEAPSSPWPNPEMKTKYLAEQETEIYLHLLSGNPDGAINILKSNDFTRLTYAKLATVCNVVCGETNHRFFRAIMADFGILVNREDLDNMYGSSTEIRSWIHDVLETMPLDEEPEEMNAPDFRSLVETDHGIERAQAALDRLFVLEKILEYGTNVKAVVPGIDDYPQIDEYLGLYKENRIRFNRRYERTRKWAEKVLI